MFTFTPLYGAQSASPASASLLELDGDVKILVDIGWDASFSTVALQELEKHVSTLSLVLLTHPTLDHIGAYAHACKHIPQFIRVPVYATIPVSNLGLTLLTDLYASSPLAASTVPASVLGSADGEATNFLLQSPSAEELSRYFNHITTLKYSQPHQPTPSQFSPSLGNLTITAYAAGHTVGGTIWHLQHGLESIVYAADWNQGRENLIGGAAWLSASSGGAEIIEPLRRPTALICSCRGVEVGKPITRRKRDDALISLIRDTLTDGGNILIPTDSSARVLELAFLLNQTWRSNADGPHAGTYKNSKIFMASKSASSTQRFLQSMLEWMDDAVIREAEAAMTGKTKTKTSSPLEWEFVRLVERQSQLDRALRRNKSSVILASDASMDWGYSRHALQKLASDPKNLIILTEMSSSSSALSSQLWSAIQEQPEARVITPKDLTLTLNESTLLPLNDEEQAIYTQYLARQRAMTTGTSTLPGNGITEDLGDVDAEAAVSESSDSDDDEDEEADAQQQGRALNLSAQLTSTKRKVGLTEEELGVDILLTAKVHDYEVQGKRGRERMFPVRTIRTRNDDFGEPITVTDYLRAEEKEELDNAEQDSTNDRKVGEKRKWNDVAATSKLKNQKLTNTPNKKIKTQGGGQDGDNIDAAIARATGVNGTVDTDSEESEYEPDEAADPTPGPKKVSSTRSELPLSARLAYVDFSARHEKRDLLMLIPLIRPRKLVLISGTQSETQMLAEESRAVLQAGSNGTTTSKSSEIEVFTPRDGEKVDASVDTNAWTLKLGRNLLRKLAWQDVRGLGIVALTGLLQAGQPTPVKEEPEEDDIAKKKRKLTGNLTAVPRVETEEAELLPVLDIPEENTRAQALIPQAVSNVNRPIHVGDLRLSDLRNLLRAAGHIADFRGEGTLLVDGVVVVRKGAGGRIDVEGGIYGVGGRGRTGESTFGEVRRKVYEGLAVVGGNAAAA